MMVEQFEVAFVNGTADIFSIFYRCSRCRKGLIHDYTRTIYNEDEDKGESTPNPQPDKSSE